MNEEKNMDKRIYANSLMTLLVAGMTQLPTLAEENPHLAAEESAIAQPSPDQAAADDEAPLTLKRKPTDYASTEKELAGMKHETVTADEAGSGEAAMIETSQPYLLPRLFTIPTAYSLKSYEVRFGGQGNIHSTVANMNSQGIKGTISVGLGGIMELGYQLDEYYTVENISDKVLMGYFKLSLLKESAYLPALSISAAKNLRDGFHAENDLDYKMDEDMYEIAFSKAFRLGGDVFGVHPGVQIIRDEVTSVEDAGTEEDDRYKATKVNPRLGLSWQTRPKTLFMYEFKYLNPTRTSALASSGIRTNAAFENNLGIRYYIRNWICIDSGIRHYYDTVEKDDEMKLHANFVGVIPMAVVYERVVNYFKN
jgi:hypothetical protein